MTYSLHVHFYYSFLKIESLRNNFMDFIKLPGWSTGFLCGVQTSCVEPMLLWWSIGFLGRVQTSSVESRLHRWYQGFYVESRFPGRTGSLGVVDSPDRMSSVGVVNSADSVDSVDSVGSVTGVTSVAGDTCCW